MARNRAIIEENLATIEDWLERNSEFVSWTPPHGGLLALLEYRLDVPSFESGEPAGRGAQRDAGARIGVRI
ncbi:MAG: hypothetical protein R3A46_01770 [Thermomicrobiales bacterium]